MKVKLLSDNYHERLLGYKPASLSLVTARNAENEYKRFGVDHLTDNCQPTELPLPGWLPTVEQLLQDAADFAIGSQLEQLQALLSADIKSQPFKEAIPLRPGWYRLGKTNATKVSHLPPDAYFFDIETHDSGDDDWLPTCAVARSATAWYVWVWSHDSPTRLIPGIEGSLLVGWFVQYDRSFVESEYRRADSGNRWLDLASCWQAVRGYGNQQRAVVANAYGVPTFTDGEEYDDEDMEPTEAPTKQWQPGSPLWTKETHANVSLDAIYGFYGFGYLDKGVRDAIVDGGSDFARDVIRDIVWYCCHDVLATYKVFTKLWPEYREAHPHDVSIAGHVLLGSAWLPLSANRFPGYYDRAEAATEAILTGIDGQLRQLAADTVERYRARLLQLTTDINSVKRPKKGADDFAARDKAVTEQRQQLLEAFLTELPIALRSLDWTPSTVGKTKGNPAWYRKAGGYTLGQRRSTALLGLRWLGEEVYWEKSINGYRTTGDIIPHPDDSAKAAFSLFTKGFVKATEDGVLTAENGEGLLKQLMTTINWVSLRKRIKALKVENLEGYPVTLPRLLVTGTITRRAADKVWQVASNPKKGRIGTELKSMVEAPPGYKIVGFDFDG